MATEPMGVVSVSIVKNTVKDSGVSVHEVAADLVDEEEHQLGFTDIFFRKRKHLIDPDATATKRSVFDDAVLAPHYWPKKNYENIHRFDPSARWTYREEWALTRKIDWKIMVMAAIGFAAMNLDRFNVNQANSSMFLTDLNLTTDDFNLGNSIFRLTFLCAELPSQLVSKRVGPDHWIPTQICLWSLVSLSQFWLTGRTSFLACRALLGALQGGFIPDLLLYLSYFYMKTELPIRLALLWMSADFCSIISSFLAFGILHLDGAAGKAGWRWLFLIEGGITLLIGVAAIFNMPASPTQTKTWFRPNGWFTEREEVIMVNRILRDDPTKGDMHNKEGLTLGRLWTAICDYDLWPLYILGLTFGIPDNPPLTYLTLLLRDIGFNTFQTNLLSIPYQVLGIVTMFLVTLLSEHVGERTFVAMLEDVWTLPFLVALYALPSEPNQWVFFGIVTGLLAFPSVAYLHIDYTEAHLLPFISFTHPIQLAWCSRNAGSVSGRTVNAALYNMFLQANSIISSQIYVASDAPRYERGNRILIVICCINIGILYPGTKAYYIWRNRQRDKIWNVMTVKERDHYLRTTMDVGNRRLDFRFAH
ncbi:allantoate permease [Pisolithus marmoratus]|nr:allantoate permease [Pisolithus marmoratus]